MHFEYAKSQLLLVLGFRSLSQLRPSKSRPFNSQKAACADVGVCGNNVP